MKKIIAVVLLVVGIGLGALGVYLYFLSEDNARCQRFRSEAVALFEQALAAEGTPRGTELAQEARVRNGVADTACRYAGQTRQNGMFAGLGGLASIIASVVLLVISRKRTA